MTFMPEFPKFSNADKADVIVYILSALVTSKWPAYRLRSPDSLNRLFRDTYNEVCRDRRPGSTAMFGGIIPSCVKAGSRGDSQSVKSLNLWRRLSQVGKQAHIMKLCDRTFQFPFNMSGQPAISLPLD